MSCSSKVVVFAVLVSFMATFDLAAQVKVSPKGAMCEIEFPAEPTSKTVDGNEQIGLRSDNNKAALMFQATSLPVSVDIRDQKAVKAFFDEIITPMKDLPEGKLLSDKSTKLDAKYPVRDVSYSIQGGNVFRSRTILSGPKLYQLTIIGSKDYQASEEVKKFVSSLKLAK